jgi:hypothetical protein
VGTSTLSIETAQKICPCIEMLIETNEEHRSFDEIKDKAPQMYKNILKNILEFVSR